MSQQLENTQQQLEELQVKYNEATAAAANAAAAAAAIKVDIALMAALAGSIFPGCIEAPTNPQSTVYTVWPGKIDPDFLDKMEKAKVRNHKISVKVHE